LTSVGLGFWKWGFTGLIAGLLGGRGAAALMLGRGAWGDKKRGLLTFSGKAMLKQAKRYYDFPLYSAPTAFLDILALQLPVFFLTRFFDSSVVGWFALTARVIGAPLTLVGSCVGQVYYQFISEATHRNDDLRSYVIQVAKYLLLLVSLPVLVAVLFSPALFTFIFGAQWGTAGENARILVIPIAIKFVVTPLTTIMWASGNIRLGSVWKMVCFTSTALVLYVAAHFSAKIFLCIYGAHDVVLYGIYFFLILKASANVRLPGRGSPESVEPIEAHRR
jgi:O-antigen/teichoic acid export membrane protein